MKVTFPRMGNAHIPLKSFFEAVGIDVVLPPPTSRRTVTLGTRHAPEFACYPLKLNIGNFIEAAERGADTIVMAGGIGPCRFGYYAQVQREILRDLGYDMEMVVLEPPCLGWAGLAREVRKITGNASGGRILRALRLAWVKCSAVDEIEARALKARPKERMPGAVTEAARRALELVEKADCARKVEDALREGLSLMEAATGPVGEEREPIRVGLVGEIFMVLDSFANLDVERRLGELGVEVHRFLSMGGWVRANLFPRFLRPREEAEMVRLARPYLNHFVGGHGVESVGGTVLYSEMGYDGVVQILPFTCMPEIVAQSILRNVSAEMGIPVLTLSLDEHTAEAGIQTRLEAFVDLLSRQKRGKVERTGRGAGREAG